MNTKEAISFLEYEVRLFPHKANSLPACLEIYKVAEKIGEITKLLKRGEEYKKMAETKKPIKKIITIDIEHRKVRALEIIAEEFIEHNEISVNIITALENIETALRGD